MPTLQPVTFEEEKKKYSELKDSDIEILRQWCNKQPHLPEITDSELALFLHSNYYRIEPTKYTIDTFYTCRTHVPEFFGNRDPIGSKDMRFQMKTIHVMPLKTMTKEGYHIILARLKDTDPSKYMFNDAMKYFNMVFDLWMYSQGCINGHVIIVDFTGVGLSHAARLSPMGVKKYLFYLQDALPVRLKALHFTSSVPAVDILVNMMRPFMKKELMDMFHVHTSLESLKKFMPVEGLPIDMGGKTGKLDDLHQEQIQILEDNRAWFQNDEVNRRVDESKRPGKAKSAQDLFGVEGVFKKLDID